MDKIGAALSIGCAVHCIITPIILPLLPMLGFFIGHDGYFHLVLSAFIVGVAAFALIPGYLKHKEKAPLTFALIGITIILLMGVLEHFIESPLIVVGTIIGSLNIITGHYLNHKYRCKCNHHKEHKCH